MASGRQLVGDIASLIEQRCALILQRVRGR